MFKPTCPSCNKAIQHRHTFLASFPLTLICAGCGSWLTLDAIKSSGLVALVLSVVTLGLAYFSLYFLVLLPLYFVFSIGPLKRYSVKLLKKRKAELWTINRRTGALRPMNKAEKEAHSDVHLSEKLAGIDPFQAVDSDKYPENQDLDCKGVQNRGRRPDFAVDGLPTGLPH